MNRKTEAEAWIAKFEAKLQRIRDQIDVKIEPGTTATTCIFYQGEFLIRGTGGTLGKLIYLVDKAVDDLISQMNKLQK